MAKIETNLILRYLKVKALAERGGTPAERASARKILAALENKYPTLKSKVLAYQRATKERSARPPHPSAPTANTAQAEKFWGSGNWENIFQYANAAVDLANDVASVLGQARKGTLLGQDIRFSSKLSTSGNILLTFRINPSTYQKMCLLTEPQKAALKAQLKRQLEAELDRIMT